MALTDEQAFELRKQLHEQVTHLPPEQRQAADQQIDSMSSESLEIMLNQQRASTGRKGKTIFRSIIGNEIDSVLVQENDFAKAVMDISPVAKGHVLVIPKTAVGDAKQLPTSVFTLAKDIAKRISSELQTTSTAIVTEIKFGEAVVHVIPSYTSPPLDLSSPRGQSNKEELEKVASQIRPKEKKKRIPLIKKPSAESQSKSPALLMKRRIP